MPAEVMHVNKILTEDRTGFSTMSGPTFLKHNGSMLGCSAIPNLERIRVPTLVYNGEHDTSHHLVNGHSSREYPRFGGLRSLEVVIWVISRVMGEERKC